MKELADLQGPIHLFNNRRHLNGAAITNEFIVNGNERVTGIHQAYDSDAKRGLQILCNMLGKDYALLMQRVEASFPGTVPTICVNGVNSATCYCGTVTCEESPGLGLKCDTSGSGSCSFPICTNTAGSTSNSVDCACGSATCTTPGRYCTSSANSCKANPICANTAGSTLNIADCHCGSATCTSSGRYCTSSDNSCSANPICVHDEDGTLNSADCHCGSATCTSSGRYCTSSTNSCSANPPPADQFYAKLFQDSLDSYYHRIEIIVQIKRVDANNTDCNSDDGNQGTGTSCEGNAYTSNKCCGTGNDCTTNARPCTDTDRPLNWYKLGVDNKGTTAYIGGTSSEKWADFELVRGEKYAVIAEDSYGDGWAKYQLQISTSTAESDNIVSITVESTNSGWFNNGNGGTAGYLVYSSGGWKFAHVGCGVFTTTNAVTDNDSKYTPSVFFGGSASTENEFAFTCTSGSRSAKAICTIDSNRECGNSGDLGDKCISHSASWNSPTCN